MRRGASSIVCLRLEVQNFVRAWSLSSVGAPPLCMCSRSCPCTHNNAARCILVCRSSARGAELGSGLELEFGGCTTPMYVLPQLPLYTQQCGEVHLRSSVFGSRCRTSFGLGA